MVENKHESLLIKKENLIVKNSNPIDTVYKREKKVSHPSEETRTKTGFLRCRLLVKAPMGRW